MNKNLSFKTTKFDWIGSIPSHWECKKIKYVFWERKEYNDPIKTNNLISLTIDKGVIPHSEKSAGGNKPKENLTKYKIVYPGDIVLNSMNVIAGAVGISKYFGVVSPVYYMLIPKNNIFEKEYFHHLFRNETFQKSLYGLGNGILIKQNEETGKLNTIRMRIPMDKLGDQFIPVPPAEEQKTISHFLNRKTSQIEMLISKIKKKIKFYNEKRVAIISEVLSDGLSKNIEKKNSGSDLIGKIPKHWDLWSIRHLINIEELEAQDGNHGEIHPKSEDYVEEGIPFVMASNLKNGKLDLENCNKLNKTQTDNLRIGFSYEGDVLLSHKGSIGKVALVEKLETDYIMLTPQVTYYRTKQKKVRRLFLYFIFQSRNFLDQMYLLSSDGSTRNFCGIVDQKNIFFPIPPLDEQKKIEAFLNDQIKKIDQILHKEKCRIHLINEYRESLISSVVTGKISLKKRKDVI